MQKFQKLVNKITSKKQFDQIYAKQIKFLDIKPFHIHQLCPQAVKKLYIQTQSRYLNQIQYKESENSWQENQRKVFVWYIIVFLYQNKLNPAEFTKINFNELSTMFFLKNPHFLQYQYLNLLRIPCKNSWSQEEDLILLNAIQKQKKGKWNQISKRIFYQSNFQIFHSPKHCRQRWFNHLDKSKQKGDWILSEEYYLLKFTLKYGKRWSKIATLMGNKRTQHMIKNRYHAMINKNRRTKKQKEEEILSQLYTKVSLSYKQQKLTKKQRIQNQIVRQNQNQNYQLINLKLSNNIFQSNVKIQEENQSEIIPKIKTINQSNQEQVKLQADSQTLKAENLSQTQQMNRMLVENQLNANQTNQYIFQYPYWMFYMPSLQSLQSSSFRLYQPNQLETDYNSSC